MNRFAPKLLGLALACALAQPAAHADELLATGVKITPAAAQGAQFQRLNPGLADFPEHEAGHAVATSLSPDGKTLLALTSGYNRVVGPDGDRDDAASNEYVFVYDVTGAAPVKRQVLQLPATFNGIAWHPDGRNFYVSGGVDDNVRVFERQDDGAWVDGGVIALGHETGLGINVKPVAAGLAVTADGRHLLVANIQNDSLSVIDPAGRAVLAEVDLRPGQQDVSKSGVPGGEYPFWVVAKGNDKAYVSSQRDREVVVVDLAGGAPRVAGRIPVGGQPNKMVLSADGARLFVANGNSDSVSVVDTATDAVVETFSVTAPRRTFPRQERYRGAIPNSLALTPDGLRLLVTNGGANAVAVVRLGKRALNLGHGDPRKAGLGQHSEVQGLIPTGWYPTSVSVSRDGGTLYVVNGKSKAGPNPEACRDTASTAGDALDACRASNQYIYQLMKAGLLSLPMPRAGELARLTALVADNNRFPGGVRDREARKTMAFLKKRIKHVIYVVKENRTYDQILGDLEVGNGDPGLTVFPEPITPNHHALARRFVTLDNFHDSGQVSGDGWNWTTAARATDYTEKTVPVNYGGKGFTYDWEGQNRNLNVGLATLAERKVSTPETPDDPDLLPGIRDVAAPDSAEEAYAGYLWDAARRAGLTMRNYGFFGQNLNEVTPTPYQDGMPQFESNKTTLRPHTDVYFRGYDQNNADFWLFKEWEREFDQYAAQGELPNLQFVRLPHDHFGNFRTAISGVNTPETQMADNDYAVGRLIEKVANSRFRDDTLIFVVEDDAQNGPDHVDAQRSIAFVAGPYVKQGAVVSEHYTTVSMVRTIKDILGMEADGLTDGLAAPMAEVFETTWRPWSYAALVPEVLRTTELPLPERTAANSLPRTPQVLAHAKPRRDAAYWERAMRGQDFAREDNLDEPRFNRALWAGLKGEGAPYPAIRHGRDLRQNRHLLLGGDAPKAVASQP